MDIDPHNLNRKPEQPIQIEIADKAQALNDEFPEIAARMRSLAEDERFHQALNMSQYGLNSFVGLTQENRDKVLEFMTSAKYKEAFDLLDES